MNNILDIVSSRDEVTLESAYTNIKKYNNYTSEGIADVITGALSVTADVIDNVGNGLLGELSSKFHKSVPYKDAMKRHISVSNKLRDLNNMDLANIIFVTPERFNGNLLSLVNEIKLSHSVFIESLRSVTALLNRDLALFSNNLPDGEFPTPASYSPAMELKKNRVKLTESISEMFSVNKSKGHSRVIDAFRSTNEIRELFISIKNFEKLISDREWKELYEETKELNDHMSTIIDALEKDNVNIKDTRSTREISDSFYEVAKGLEFVGYIHAIKLQIYASVESLSVQILRYNKP